MPMNSFHNKIRPHKNNNKNLCSLYIFQGLVGGIVLVRGLYETQHRVGETDDKHCIFPYLACLQEIEYFYYYVCSCFY